MIRHTARIFSLFSILVLAGLVLAAALPGTHRIAFPGAYGLTEVADRVWTDAPSRSHELRSMANSARRTVARFFGDRLQKPSLILCTSTRCAQDFGIGGNGLSVPRVGVMVSPGGLTQGTLTHEMTHFRLHRKLGLRNLIRQPFPTWFDEGLATHVANHPNWQGTVTAKARLRVRETSHFWQWDDTYRELGVGRAYAAAAAEVAAIERQVGRDGLRELIARAEAGEDFVAVLNTITRR